jgi:protein phosphatase
MNTIIQLIAKTHKGLVREGNEDNFIVTENISNPDWILPKEDYTNPPQGSLLAVADGMGGLNAGEVASKAAVEAIRNYFSKLATATGSETKVLSLMKNAILQAHRTVIKTAGKKPELQDMGTTLIIGWLINDRMYISWSGDSRCYYFRETAGLQQLSKDHSYVQTLVDEGRITEEQAFFHPQNNIVLQSLGDNERPPEPDTAMLPLVTGDIVLLCSDGLNGMLTHLEMEAIIRIHQNDLRLCCDKLIDAANEAGGGDNITVVLAKVIRGQAPSQNAEPHRFNGTKKRSRLRRLGLILLAVLILLTSVALYAMWVLPPRTPTHHPVRSPDSVLRDTTRHRVLPPAKTGTVPAPHPQTPPAHTLPVKKNSPRSIDSLKAGDPSKDTIRLHVEKQDSVKQTH